MKIVKETPTYVLVDYNNPTDQYICAPTKEKKFLCIGGPFAGQLKASVQVTGYYMGFNRADAKGIGRKLGRRMLSRIWVYDELLGLD